MIIDVIAMTLIMIITIVSCVRSVIKSIKFHKIVKENRRRICENFYRTAGIKDKRYCKDAFVKDEDFFLIQNNGKGLGRIKEIKNMPIYTHDAKEFLI